MPSGQRSSGRRSKVGGKKDEITDQVVSELNDLGKGKQTNHSIKRKSNSNEFNQTKAKKSNESAKKEVKVSEKASLKVTEANEKGRKKKKVQSTTVNKNGDKGNVKVPSNKKTYNETSAEKDDGSEVILLKVRAEDEDTFAEESTVEWYEEMEDMELECSLMKSVGSESDMDSEDEQEMVLESEEERGQSSPQPSCSGYSNNNAKIKQITEDQSEDEEETEEERSMLHFAKFFAKRGFLQQVSTDVGESSKKIPRRETSGKEGRNNTHHKGNKNWVDNNHSNSETTLYKDAVAMELNDNIGVQHGNTEIEVDNAISF